MNHANNPPITILGAGLAGSLMAVMLARRELPVRIIERRPDPRVISQSAGRSINLALAERGMHALRMAGVMESVQKLLIPMRGRMVHELDGTQHLVPYGQRPHEVIYSISRPGLNEVLLDHAERRHGVELIFAQACEAIDLDAGRLKLSRHGEARGHSESFTHLIAADGYQSVVREALMQTTHAQTHTDVLPHGYKELTLPASANGKHQFAINALHIWPRGGFMLIALPNVDGSFTVTLFLPFNNSDAAQPSFAQLQTASDIEAFFAKHFADALALMPNLAEEFMTHPTGKMATVRCSQWTNARNAVLIGDAAHAVVPFHGQGMNCAFEDCLRLDTLLQAHDFGTACETFTTERLPNTNAIADMALENYIEMRDTVRDPRFLLQKQLSFELERRFPTRFIPRYSMVMFHHDIPYAEAQRRGCIQQKVMDTLTANCDDLSKIDWLLAERLVMDELPPLQ